MSCVQDNDSAAATMAIDPDSPESAHGRGYDEAPRYSIPAKVFAAVEVPAVVRNLDRAVKAFGRVPSLQHTLDPLRQSIPLYLNPENPFCNPIVSHNTASHNIVLKVTVPKRTGRKRKRGSNEPWREDTEEATATSPQDVSNVSSTSRIDEPRILQRKLQDNVKKYEVDAVGTIKHTHRFRGLADFCWDMSNSSLAQRYVDRVLPGDIQKLKSFKLDAGIDPGPNVDIIPPPIFTHMNLPFNYNYSQNPYVRITEDGDTINMTAIKQVGYFIGADDPIPTAPQEAPDMTDARTAEVMAEMKRVFEERPIWTRRSILNRLDGTIQNWNELKKYLNYAAYQFKGGPWRDGVVPYGIDPRSDPKYRIYQTLMFKLQFQPRTANQSWHSLRRDGQANLGQGGSNSHIFDGETYDTDGKVWQVCDITDPLLRDLLDNATVRPECDMTSGWYHGGLWAKVKAVMKTKLVAIHFGKKLSRADFTQTLQFGDLTPTKTYSANLHIPLPKLGLTDEELRTLRGRQPPKKRSQGYNIRLKARSQRSVLGSSVAPEASTAAAAAAGSGGSPSQEGGSESGSDNDTNFLDDEDEFDQDQDEDPGADQDMGDADF